MTGHGPRPDLVEVSEHRSESEAGDRDRAENEKHAGEAGKRSPRASRKEENWYEQEQLGFEKREGAQRAPHPVAAAGPRGVGAGQWHKHDQVGLALQHRDEQGEEA